MMPSSTTQTPTWFGFVVGLLAGFAASALLIGLVLGYSLGGTFAGGPSYAGPAAVPAAPTDVPAAPTAAAKPVPPIADRDHVRGPANAKITFVEYSDFECPFCKRHAPTIDSVLSKYKNDVKFVYRHFPLSFHPKAQKLAEGSECAAELGGNDAFWKYHDAVFAKDSVEDLGADQLPAFAKTLGLNEAKFKACLDSGKHAQYIADQEQGGIDAGVQGTPGNFLILNSNGETQDISGAVPEATLTSAIDALLAK
jgi:protein-disulfide isomerase